MGNCILEELEQLKEKAQKGEIAAQNTLGAIFEFGQMNQEIDMENAFYWYRKAAEKGDISAAEQLLRICGNTYASSYISRGHNKKSNEVDDQLLALGRKGFESYKKRGLEDGNEEASYYVAITYIEGIMGTEEAKDVLQGGKLMEELAASGNPYALYEIGLAHKIGSLHRTEFKNNKYTVNSRLSFEYFEKAADKGIVSAKYNMYCFLKDGIGCKKDLRKSFWYLESAAEDGLAIAQMDLAFKFLVGTGESIDAYEGFKWLEKAAYKGVSQSRIQLAHCYLKGIGCSVNVNMAEIWASRARKGKLIDFPPMIKIGRIPKF